MATNLNLVPGDRVAARSFSAKPRSIVQRLSSQSSVSLGVRISQPSSQNVHRDARVRRISAQATETSSTTTNDDPSTLFDSQLEGSKSPYPGGLGPYTGRDPNVKKPAWLRQRAPQGERYTELKGSLSTLKLNTVCEEAQCPNIGEVIFQLYSLIWFLLLYRRRCSGKCVGLMSIVSRTGVCYSLHCYGNSNQLRYWDVEILSL